MRTNPLPGRTALLASLFALLLGSPGGAQRAVASALQLAANTEAAQGCAKTLPADSKLIFDATLKNMKGLDTIRDVVEQQTRALVSAGKIGMLKARSAAETAGTCLKLLAS